MKHRAASLRQPGYLFVSIEVKYSKPPNSTDEPKYFYSPKIALNSAK